MHQKKTQEAKNARKKSSPHEVGLHLFIPKYRRKVLYGDNRQKVMDIIKRLCRDIDVEIVEGAMCPDHIHMSLRIPPRLSVAYVMGYLEGKSVLKLLTRILDCGALQGRTGRCGREDTM